MGSDGFRPLFVSIAGRVSLRRVFSFFAFVVYFLALLMVPSALVAFAADDHATLQAFVFPAMGTLAVGVLLRFLCRGAGEPRGRDAFGIVVFGWLLAALICATPFMAAGKAGFVDSAFESMSGLTTTGATIFPKISGPEGLASGLLLWRAIIQWLGGLGIVLVVSVLLSFMESQGTDVLRTEVSVITHKITPRLAQTGLVLTYVYLGLTTLQTALMMLGGMSLFDAVCHSFTTMSTGGFSTQTDSLGAYQSLYLEIVTIAFMILGAANFTLHYRLFKGDWLAHLKSAEFRGMLAIMVGAGAAIAGLLILYQPNITPDRAFRDGIFQSVSVLSTTGFTTTSQGDWPASARFLLFLLMFIGGSVGSTAGAIKVRRLLIVFKAIVREFQKILHPSRVSSIRMDGEAVDESIVRKFVLLALLWVVIVFLGGVALMLMNIDPETAFSASATCMGNVGPGLGTASVHMADLPPGAKVILTVWMLVGRLEIFTVIVLFSPVVWRQSG